MITKIQTSGYTFEINDEGWLSSSDWTCGASSPGNVAVKVVKHTYDYPPGQASQAVPIDTDVVSAILPPSAARAIASVILSAATEAAKFNKR